MLPQLLLVAPLLVSGPLGPQVAGRPRIGLVLSGGGARGAAHVGVLEVLEEAHVPVDFVVGTSMGAIVGGMYAAGSSPQEIRATIESLDWGTLFDDDPDREHLAWRRRQEDRDFLIGLEMGWKDGGLAVPRGVVQGLKIEPLFRKLTLRVADTRDFDELPLPFRAVAMDLGTGERVVIGDGDLAEAMRASMSIAGAFAPVERDGKELVDGGYVDNLPVQLALDMGADIVIAVDVGTPPESNVQNISNLLSVASHVQDVLVHAGRVQARAALRAKDVLIEPELGTISFADFGKSLEAAEAGHAAAVSKLDALRAHAVSDEQWTAFVARHRAPAKTGQPISRVRIENHSTLSDAVIESRIRGLRLTELDPDAVDEDLARLAGLGVFDRVDFRTTPAADGSTELVYSVREKSWGPNYLRFGLGLYDEFDGRGLFSLGVGWTTVPFHESGAELRTSLTIGTPLRVTSELWIPLDPGLRWFVAPSGTYEKRTYDLDEDPEIRGDVSVEAWNVGADVGRVLGDWGEVRVGARYGTDSNHLERAESASGDADLDVGALVSSFSWDTLDAADFPTTGTIGGAEAFASLDALGSTETFESLRLRGSVFETLGGTTFGFGVDAGSSFDDTLPVSRGFFLGGFTRLSGTSPDSQVGDQILLVRAIAWRPLTSEKGMLGMPLYVGGSLEGGHVWVQSDDADLGDLDPAGSVFFAANTPLGPAALVLGIANGEGAGLALVFGRLY